MGPVRHLGLSRAHGEVSAFVEFGLGWDDDSGNDYRARNAAENDNMGENGTTSMQEHEHEHDEEDMDRKPAAVAAAVEAVPAAAVASDLMSMSLRDAAMSQQLSDRQQRHDDHDHDPDDDRKPAAMPLNGTGTSSNGGKSASSGTAMPVESMHELDVEATGNGIGGNGKGSSSNIHRSSTVQQNSNPIWPTSQRDGNRSLFTIRLPKRRSSSHDADSDGNLNSNTNTDGQRIKLRITVREEMTGIEHVLPDPFGLGLTRGGEGGSSGGIVGYGEVDVTELALGETSGLGGSSEMSTNADGSSSTGESGDQDGNGSRGAGGVIDAWATLALPLDGAATSAAAAAASSSSHAGDDEKGSAAATAATAKCTGRVRVLVSYEPHGMPPRRGDVAALESFARRNPSKSSCRLIIPPLAPLRVLEVVGSYCLVEYDFPSANVETLTSRGRKKQYAQGQHGNGSSGYDKKSSGGSGKGGRKVGTARIHRNSIFVIERTNAVDSAVNLALTPVDAVLSTSLGRATSQIAAPIIGAAGELVAPAMLTGRIMLASVNTVGAVGLSSAGAVVSTVAKSLDPNKNNNDLDDDDPLSKI